MRVLMLSWEYPPNVAGGLGRHVAQLAPTLAQQGVEVHVVTPESKNQDLPVIVEAGVAVHRVFVPLVGVSTVDIYSRAVEANKVMVEYVSKMPAISGPFDLIHTHDWLTGFAAMAIKQAWGCPLVATIHATERGRGRGYLSNDLQRSIDNAEQVLTYETDRIIVCSHVMSSEVQHFFQTPDSKLDIVPNGVNIADLRNGHPKEMLSAYRAKYAAPEEVIVFTISRLVHEKGIHWLVNAAPRILTECPQVRFIIAGTGPEADNLKQQAESLGVAGRVKFTGFISDEDRNHLYKVSTCAVFPSLYEPFGIVALEAMALGCPVVVSDVGGLTEVVTHTETGITIYPDDDHSLAWGVLHTLNHPDLAQEWATKARQTVKELFNWSRIAGLTLDAYRRALLE